MKEKPLKTADIAEISGLTENEITSVTEEYHGIVPCRKFGRITLYEHNAASKISEIVRMRNEGLSKEEIYADSGKKAGTKSTHEKVRERIRKEGSSGGIPGKFSQPKDSKTTHRAPPDTQSSTNNNSGRLKELSDSRRNRESTDNTDKIAAQALKTDRAILRIEKLESEIETLKEKTERDRRIIQSYFDNIERKYDIISEWMEFFDGEREKIRDGIEKSHLKQNNELKTIRKEIEENHLSHENEIEKIKEEIEILKLPWLKRRKYK